MVVLSKFNLDMEKKSNPPIVYAMQNDINSRVVEISLFSNSVPWNVPIDSSVSVAFKNVSDGHKGWYDKLPDNSIACTTNGNVVTAVLAPAVLSSPGEVRTVIVFQDENLNQLATFNFSVIVENNPSADISISNDYYAYSTMEDISNAVDAMLDSLEEKKIQIDQFIDQTNDIVTKIAKENAPPIECNAKGEVITLKDSSNRLVRGLNIYGKTTQDGTPTPENPVELESVGGDGNISVTVLGKNLFGGEALADKLVAESSGTKKETERTVSFYCSNAMGKKYFTNFKPNTQYTFIMYGNNNASGYLNLMVGYTDGTYKDNFAFAKPNENSYVVFTTPEGKSVEYFGGVYRSGTTTLYYDKCGIFEGVLTEADFEAYTEQTLTAQTPNGLPGIPVTSGGNYTDESGQQWICDEVDFAKGVYVQRVERVDLGTLQWAIYGSSGAFYAPNYLIDLLPSPCAMCKSYPYVNASSISNVTKADYCVGLRNDTGKYYILVKNKDNATDIDAITASLQGVFLYYPLAEENPIALSAEELAQYAALHTNKPNTTVFNDANAYMELDYVADTKMYIDNKFAELAAAMVSNSSLEE